MWEIGKRGSDSETVAEFDTLRGAKGLVFLMYLGREVITNDVASILCDKEVVENKEVVYQYSKKLEKMGLLKVAKEDRHARGRPRFLTADRDALLSYISRCSMGELLDKDEKCLSSALTSTAKVLDYYPEYLKASLNGQSIRSLRWNKILSNFLFFFLEFVRECWLLREYPKVRPPLMIGELGKWKDLERKGKISKEMLRARENSVKLSFGLSNFVKDHLQEEEITEVASLMKDKDALYKDTFTGRLQFVSITIADSHLAGWLDNYRKFLR